MSKTVSIFCVYGNQHIEHLKRALLPSIARATVRPVQFWAINYASGGATLDAGDFAGEVHHVSNEGADLGFAQGHNKLFAARGRVDDFIIINPDCVFADRSIDILVERKARENSVGIVEARQWPWEHPKEYDELTGETPWASGAAQLIDGAFYEETEGMDENYFLYLEDVDLSWQAWSSGRRVIYERLACVAHYTNGPFYRLDLLSNEEYLSLRNFIYISRKFFGKKGELQALEQLAAHHDPELVGLATQDYEENLRVRLAESHALIKHPQIKILGINRFHISR